MTMILFSPILTLVLLGIGILYLVPAMTIYQYQFASRGRRNEFYTFSMIIRSVSVFIIPIILFSVGAFIWSGLTSPLPIQWVLLTVLVSTIFGSVISQIINPRRMNNRHDWMYNEYQRGNYDSELSRLAQKRLELQGLSNVDFTSKRLKEIINEKKEKFLNIPTIAFHFVDAEQVKSNYNDYFKEPTIETLVSDVAVEINSGIKGSLPQVLESSIGSKDFHKWVSTIKLPDISLNSMFQRYQRETIKNNQVALGIEEVDIELSELEDFEESIQEIKDQFELVIDEGLLNNKRTQLKEKAAEKTLNKLEQITGSVLIEGKFKIEDKDDFYRCVFSHPVNQYLSQHVGPVTISVLIRKNSLEQNVAGNYLQSINRMVPLRIYGQVWEPVDKNAGMWELKLTPLAIY